MEPLQSIPNLVVKLLRSLWTCRKSGRKTKLSARVIFSLVFDLFGSPRQLRGNSGGKTPSKSRTRDLERWLSGRKRLIANPLYDFFSYRGFESLSLRFLFHRVVFSKGFCFDSIPGFRHFPRIRLEPGCQAESVFPTVEQKPIRVLCFDSFERLSRFWFCRKFSWKVEKKNKIR